MEVVEYYTDWGTSEAKEILQEDIISQRINGMGPNVVYNDPQRHEYYKHYKYENFCTNLNNLRKKVLKGINKAKQDCTSYDAFTSSRAGANPIWHGSEAQTLLRTMVKNKESVGREPQEICASSILFVAHTKAEFRNHLTHEKTHYWKRENTDDCTERIRFLNATIGTSTTDSANH